MTTFPDIIPLFRDETVTMAHLRGRPRHGKLLCQNMHIAVVSDTYPPDVNGVAMTLERLTMGLRERGHFITVIAPEHEQQPASAGNFHFHAVMAFPVPGYPMLRFGLPGPGELVELFQQRRPDVIYVATESAIGYTAIRAAEKFGIPVCSGFHTNFDSYMADYRAPFLTDVAQSWFKHFHNKTACTFAPTEETKIRLASMGIERLEILGRGVDTSLFHHGRRDPELRKQWGAGEGVPVILVVGRVAAEKNLPFAAKVMDHLQKIRPDARGVFVGDGPKLPELRERNPRHVFSGVQLGVDLARHYASADIFLFVSMSETYGNVVAEAMASGLIVAGYHYAAAAKFLDEGKNGFTAPLGDEAAFLLAAEKALHQWDNQQIRQEACQAVKPFSWSSVIQDFESTLLRYMDVPCTIGAA
jgi:glycosyltransferase involved in cell wall biosynthesis